TGIAGYVPDKVLTNKDLEKLVDTNDEWIKSRTGIETRHILEKGKGTSFMGGKAVEELLSKTNTKAEEIDLIICATVTPDHVFPSTANIIGDLVGAKNAWSFDINAACSGFLYALATGSQFIESGKYKKVIIVGADKMSSIVDYTDRTTCVIFGDGAGAVMLEPTEDKTIGIKDSILYSDGAGKKHLYQKSGGSVSPASEETVKNREHFVYQEGQPVFKAAVTAMADVSAEIMEKNNLKAEDVSWLVPHQANLRIIDATARRMGLSTEKVMINIQKYGNTTAGTLPLCLADWETQLKKGDNIILSTFGGGFTWGAMYLTWGYSS
ncbi:MAG: beta-ketoacyl-ACP synthase III, partial [Flavobacteriales bacterium]